LFRHLSWSWVAVTIIVGKDPGAPPPAVRSAPQPRTSRAA
jgi:hypothetical protein